MRGSPIRTALRVLLGLVFIVDGVLHWTHRSVFQAIVPDWAPAPEFVVLATGVAAFAGGVGLLVPWTQKAAGIALAVYCVCVYPANVHHALAQITINQTTLGWGYHGPRLLLQPVFVWACLWAAGAVDWPFRGTSAAAQTRRGQD